MFPPAALEKHGDPRLAEARVFSDLLRPRSQRRESMVPLWVLAGFLTAGTAAGQVPQPKLNTFAPTALMRGSTNQITASGSELDEPSRILFSDARITSQPSGSGFSVFVPTNVPTGLVEAWFVGRFGTSTPRRLLISANPEIVLPATNHSRSTAFALPPSAAVNGRLEASQVAWFRCPSPGAAGLRLHVATASLDSRVEPDLAVWDSAGRQLARSRLHENLTLTSAPAGDLWISLNDLRFRGGEGFNYRLTHGTLAEESRRVLEAGGRLLATASVRMPATRTNVLTAPTNALLSIAGPAEIRGVFPRRGQIAGVSFTAAKGTVYWVEIAAHRLGYPTDPLVLIQRVRPKEGAPRESVYSDVLELPKLDANVGGVEHPSGTRDSAGRFEAPEDGTYRILIRDQFAQTPTATLHPWHLSVRPETPGVALVVVPTPLPRQVDNDRQIYGTAINLRRGETAALKVLAYRADGFSGDIELLATNLPPGLTATPGRIAAGQQVGALLITAETNLAAGADLVTVLGRYTVGNQTRLSTARAGAALWSVPDWDQERPPVRLTKSVALGRVGTEPAPLKVSPSSNVVEVVAGGKITLPFQIERHGEFTAGFKLKAAGRPELEKAKELDVAEKGTNATVELNLAETALPVGTHTIWWEGRAPGKYRNQPEAVEVAKAELKTAEETLAKVSAGDKAAAEKRKQEAADRVKAAEERAKPRDVFAAVVSRPIQIRVMPKP